MSDTPISDFLDAYVRRGASRFHMPGHKGRGGIAEKYDITETDGADSLYFADGIIAESEKKASAAFGCPTFYSTEGSSLPIRAMLYLVCAGKRDPVILAARNVHKTFVYACASLGADIDFLDGGNSFLSAETRPGELAAALERRRYDAVFITSPDYLGKIADVRALSEVCRRAGVPLLVDAAHGAYLKFLSPSLFPIDLGADICCTSAHKTLPVLTGGAYLHLREGFVKTADDVKHAMSVFASTSPSYLILRSLDLMNARFGSFGEDIARFLPRVDRIRDILASRGIETFGDEPMKITVCPKSFGYTGDRFAAELTKKEIYVEFHDPDRCVLLPSPSNSRKDMKKLADALAGIQRRDPVTVSPPPPPRRRKAMTVREALTAEGEAVPARESEGRILQDACLSCPPAVPVAMSGEVIGRDTLEAFDYYGIKTVRCVALTNVEEKR